MNLYKKNTLALALVVALSCLTGCPSSGGTRPDIAAATRAEHTVTEKLVYVPIDAALTAHGEVAPSGKPSDAERVAAERKVQVLACYGQLDQIKAIQGTPKE